MEDQLKELHKTLCRAGFSINAMIIKRKISKASLAETEQILKSVQSQLNQLMQSTGQRG